MSVKETKKPVKPLISFRDFCDKLYNHQWVYLTDNFKAYFEQKRKEDQLLQIALQGGPDYLREFLHKQRLAISGHYFETSQKRLNEACDNVRRYVPTGDEEFDQFRQRVANHDWYWQYSDDINVSRNASERENELKKYAYEKGGLYETYWKYACSVFRKN